MSRSVDAESASDSRPSRPIPAVCRVTVLAPGVEVDLSLPSDTVVASLLPGIASLIAEHRAARGESDGDQHAMSTIAPTLTTLAGTPLDPGRSLAEFGVQDGDLLVLHDDDAAPPPPLFDDVVHAVSTSADCDRWTPESARVVGSVAAVVAATAGAATAVLDPTAGIVGGAVGIAVAVALTVVGCAVGLIRDDPRTAVVLCGGAVPVAFAAGMLVVPGNDIASDCALGSAVSAALALLTLRFGNVERPIFTAVAVACVVLSLACLWGATTAVPRADIAAVAAATCVLAFTWAPRMAMLHSRMPLPHVPVTDSPALFDHTEPAVSASFDAIRSRTVAAQQFLTGYVAGLSTAAAAAALLAVSAGRSGAVDWISIVLALSVGLVLALRGRTYVDRVQASVSIVAGSVVPAGLLVGAALSFPERSPLWCTGFALFGLTALVLGVMAPTRTFSPVLRRTTELVEFAAIAAIIPLVCWVVDLFALVRAL
ncbi:type VII secretion integral membrane protein EccD [Rhodococcoides trifolii]|nr:type VII secretion integral membrane protein EccD [Rhodococcus trifolii]